MTEAMHVPATGETWAELRARRKRDRALLIAKLRAQGQSLQEISNQVGISRERTRQLLKEIGLDSRDRTKLDATQLATLIEQRRDGASWTALAETWGFKDGRSAMQAIKRQILQAGQPWPIKVNKGKAE